MAAPEGNTNSKAENRLWGNTIRRAVAQDPEKLRRIAEKLLADAEAGDIQAIKEMGDRLDGKATQQTEISGPDGQAIPMQTIVNFVTPGAGTG